MLIRDSREEQLDDYDVDLSKAFGGDDDDVVAPHTAVRADQEDDDGDVEVIGTAVEAAPIFGARADDDDDGDVDWDAMFGPEAAEPNYAAALEWHKRKYNVVPRHATNKHPAVKWKELQARMVTRAELLEWHSKFVHGVGFITGAVSGIIVIESDGLAGQTVLDLFECEYGPLPKTLVIRSGSHRGFHFHFKHPGRRVKTVANPSIELDVRGDGGFCVLPPTKHKSGGYYEVVVDAEPAELPLGLLGFIEMKAAEASGVTIKNDASTGVRVDLRGPGAGNGPPPPVETMRAMLEHLASRNAFEDRDVWIKFGMALRPAYGADVGFELWEITHEDDRARNDAPAQWKSFADVAQPGHVGIGTIIKAARDLGFVEPQQPITHIYGLRQAEEMLRYIDPRDGRKSADVIAWIAQRFGEAGRELARRWSRGDLFVGAGQ